MIKDTAARITREKIAPRAAEIDKKCEYPWDVFNILNENDMIGADMSTEYGGSGFGLLATCVIVEEIAKACASSALIVASQDLGAMPIQLSGSHEQKLKYLTPLAKGDKISAFALTEPAAGSDAGGMKTKAIKIGNKYILNGEKCFITNGGIADIYSVFAKTSPDAKGPRGISSFIIEKDTPGFSIGKHEDKMGIRGSVTTSLIFEDCEVPEENLLGQEGKGFAIAMMTLDRTRPVIGSQALGIAEGALEYVLGYTKERQQFGQSVASFQALQFMMADMATKVEAAKLLIYKCASMLDKLPKNLDRLPKEVGKLSAMAKVFPSDVAMSVTTDAVQLAGGYGYMKEYPLERMMRDAKITQIYEGTNQIQRIVISNSILF
jgi:alkylation response protein AidB-like acyl-CoA dehydrogenase